MVSENDEINELMNMKSNILMIMILIIMIWY